ncbi:MAG: hypothetical protein PHV30_10730 [Candidatus Margulisbacteria bacterium]|nr:hypothetical protein [Candidatus Margulisiibacteriota bacterium]
MAKVTGPLFSVDARGKIADTIVFMGWRGLKTVRRWLKPANPRTVAQVTTRNFFSTAVSLFQNLSGFDKGALRTEASGQPYSGFNLWVGWVKKCLDSGKSWVTISDVTAAPGSSGSGECTITGSCSEAIIDLVIRYGRTTSLLDGETEVTTGANSFTKILNSLLPNETYYFKVLLKTPNSKQGETGIYSFVSPSA